MNRNKYIHIFIISIFVLLYLFVSLISMLHVVDFFELSNSKMMAISLAIAFEVGAAASLASIIVMHKMKKGIVWSLFILLTLMQIMGNMYNSYSNLADFQLWIELFGLEDKPIIFQKRILAAISGMPLPLIALGFIKALTDYIRPTQEDTDDFKHRDTDEMSYEDLEEDTDDSSQLDVYDTSTEDTPEKSEEFDKSEEIPKKNLKSEVSYDELFEDLVEDPISQSVDNDVYDERTDAKKNNSYKNIDKMYSDFRKIK